MIDNKLQHSIQYSSRLLFIYVFLCMLIDATAWQSNPKAFRAPKGSSPPSARGLHPKQTTDKPSLTEQKMLRNGARLHESTRNPSIKLSNSVLASCDTLPAFPTAHGLLSPETVMRMEDLASQGHGSEAVVNFLDHYRRHGPMSCLHMLSDPDILPHLTQAMREIAE